MTDLMLTIDSEACITCGACVQDCPFGVLALEEVPVLHNPDACIGCQHCLAICPTGALSILGKDPAQSIPLVPGNLPSFAQVDTLIRGRRSVRQYSKEGLPPELLHSLLETAWHAPTAVNRQNLHLTVIDQAQQMHRLAEECQQRLAELQSSTAFPEGPIRLYVERGLQAWQERKIDIFFRGAPHLVMASAPKDSPACQTDPVILLSYLELAASSLGLGTLWNGLARLLFTTLLPDLQARLGIPADHHLGGVMLLGRPAVTYARTVQRGPARVSRSPF